MFRCRGCEAKDGEILRLNERVGHVLDLLAAQQGTLGQVVAARQDAEDRVEPPTPPDTPEDEEAVDWRQAELERVALKKGPITPDFP